MKKDEVPQDNISTYAGQQKLFYAVDRDGHYTGVQSTGWEVEGEATKDALRLIHQDRLDAWQRAQQGATSPLEYHMYSRRMDVALLSQATGFFQWRVRRHFKPPVFNKLTPKTLSRYSEALGMPIEAIRQLPKTPPNEDIA